MCWFLQTPLWKKEEIFRRKTFHKSLYGPAKWTDKGKVAKTETKAKMRRGMQDSLSLELPPPQPAAPVPARPTSPRSIQALWQAIGGLCSACPSIATRLPPSAPLLPPSYLINQTHSSCLFPYRSPASRMGKGVNAFKGKHLLTDSNLQLLPESAFFFSLGNKILWLKEVFGVGIVTKCSLCPTSAELTNSLLAVSGLMRKEALLRNSGHFCIAKWKVESEIFQRRSISFRSPIKRKEKREYFCTITVSAKQLTY